MLWGILAAAAFVLAAAKYAARRMCGGKYDRLFLQIHKLAGALLPVSALVHGALMVRRSPTAGQTSASLRPGRRVGCPWMISCCSEECCARTTARSGTASHGPSPAAKMVTVPHPR